MLQIAAYALEVKFEFAPDYLSRSAPGWLTVKARLQVENVGAEPAATLPLLFYRLHKVSGVTVNGLPAEAVSRITGLDGLERQQINAVSVRLPESLPPGASCSVAFDYGGVTAGAREVWPYMWDSVTKDYTLLRPDILWYPEAAPPDLQAMQRAYWTPKHFDVRVAVPDGYTAVGPDPVALADGVARFRTAAPRERFDLAVAPFTRLESGSVSIYHLPDHGAWGAAALSWVTGAQKGLTDRLGSRGTNGLAIVQIPAGWGSQNTPGLILQVGGPPENWQAAAEVMHEVSHFWTPVPADWPRRFSDESLACFFEYLLVGDLFGPEKAAEQLAMYQRSVSRAPGAAEVRFLDAQVKPELHSAVWYSKGALALHALRDQLGDERFWSLLRAYTQEPTATTKGFAELLNRLCPGPDTEAFVRHWFG